MVCLVAIPEIPMCNGGGGIKVCYNYRMGCILCKCFNNVVCPLGIIIIVGCGLHCYRQTWAKKKKMNFKNDGAPFTEGKNYSLVYFTFGRTLSPHFFLLQTPPHTFLFSVSPHPPLRYQREQPLHNIITIDFSVIIAKRRMPVFLFEYFAGLCKLNTRGENQNPRSTSTTMPGTEIHCWIFVSHVIN